MDSSVGCRTGKAQVHSCHKKTGLTRLSAAVVNRFMLSSNLCYAKGQSL
jgi:hypothetical protein